jgi:hypothetical protein
MESVRAAIPDQLGVRGEGYAPRRPPIVLEPVPEDVEGPVGVQARDVVRDRVGLAVCPASTTFVQ